jgi:hypothetical protein
MDGLQDPGVGGHYALIILFRVADVIFFGISLLLEYVLHYLCWNTYLTN